MKSKVINPNLAALFGFLLCLPGMGMMLLLSFVLHIEPDLGPFQFIVASSPDGPNIPGSLIALSAILLLPTVALVLNLASIPKDMRFADSLMAHPANLVLIILVLIIIVTFVGAFIVDQYPCWIGVPNCD